MPIRDLDGERRGVGGRLVRKAIEIDIIVAAALHLVKRILGSHAGSVSLILKPPGSAQANEYRFNARLLVRCRKEDRP